jgi:ribosomal protein S18 acetylase RimI-like enzyme
MKRIDRVRKSGTPLLPSRFAPGGRRANSSRTGKVSLRRANPSDGDFVGELSGKAFGVYGPYRSLVPRWFESESAITLLAVEKGKPVGFAMMGRLVDDSEEKNRCELLAIAVEPEVRRRGIGRMLLGGIEREAGRLDEHILVLHTATDNISAQHLFKKNGFVTLSLKKHFYPSGQDAVMMMKVL